MQNEPSLQDGWDVMVTDPKEKGMDGQKADGAEKKTRRGRPKGALNRTTEKARKFLAAHQQEVLDLWLQNMRDGDPASLKLAVERLHPKQREAPLPAIAMPKIETMTDVPAALSAVLEAASRGELSGAELSAYVSAIAALGKSIEATVLEERVEKLERLMEARKS